MKNIVRSVFFVGLFFGFAARALAASEPAPTLDRNAAAKKATADRLAYAASSDYNPYETKSGDFKKAATEYIGKKKYAKAITQAKKGLAIARYDIDLLIILATAYRESGDIPNADKTREQWMSLVDSILSTGDGRDFKTAFQVITVAEEYAVLRALGLQPNGQSLVENEGSAFDLMKVKDPRFGKEFTFYFNIDLPNKWLATQLSQLKK